MPVDRSEDRNVHFFNPADPKVFGGLIQNGSVTETNFHDMISIICLSEGHIQIRERVSGRVVSRTNEPLSLGEYDIFSDYPITLNDEVWAERLITHSSSGQDNSFRDRVRARDGRCVLSGRVNRQVRSGNWAIFDAAHIFPLAKESYWREQGFDHWITDSRAVVGHFESKINSVQNGFILEKGAHSLWDQYLVSVNPDDGYKIIAFDLDSLGLDGRTLDPVCRVGPDGVPDQLLRWHYRQSVLGNMRAAGEPIFEHDFPPGMDMIGEIIREPHAQRRLEMEFESRLQHMM